MSPNHENTDDAANISSMKFTSTPDINRTPSCGSPNLVTGSLCLLSVGRPCPAFIGSGRPVRPHAPAAPDAGRGEPPGRGRTGRRTGVSEKGPRANGGAGRQGAWPRCRQSGPEVLTSLPVRGQRNKHPPESRHSLESKRAFARAGTYSALRAFPRKAWRRAKQGRHGPCLPGWRWPHTALPSYLQAAARRRK